MAHFTRLGPTETLNQEGIHVEAIARSTNLSESQVRDEVENLIQEGHLFSTTDENQWVFFLLSRLMECC